MNYDSMVRLVRRVRKVARLNKIDGIRMIREAFPKRGFKNAKDFFDWIDGYDCPATIVAGQWCRECWCDRVYCKFDHDPVLGFTVAAAPAKTKVTDEVALKIETVKVPKTACRCGDAKCADPWHAAGMWVGQQGNYAKLQCWLSGEEVEGVPFERHGAKVFPKGVRP